MRYLLRRFGEFYDISIPKIVEGANEILPDGIPLEGRYKPYFQNGRFLIFHGYNRLNTREFTRSIIDLRIKNIDKIIYLPGPFNPYDMPVLFYLGIDILDGSIVRYLGEDKCIYPPGIYGGSNCVSHNRAIIDNIMEDIRNSLTNGSFRELVEFYSNSPFSREILRIADTEFYDSIEPFIDHIPRRIEAGSLESLYRPELMEYRKRIESLAPTAENLLLIPCSAVKPYSNSKSHRVLHSFIGKYLRDIQEIIVTSPLGLVPRELEKFYPPAYYDIPVTGYWYEEEKKMLVDIAKKFFENKKYRKVFYILPKGEDIILDIFEEKIGLVGKLNSDNSIKLANILAKELGASKVSKRRLEIANILKYFYELNLDHNKITYENQGNREMVFLDGEPLVKITMNGPQVLSGMARLLVERGRRIINIKEEVSSSNIFLPVVSEISEDIRPGDQVVVTVGDKVLGYGTAVMSHIDLKYQKKGLVVKDFRKIN